MLKFMTILLATATVVSAAPVSATILRFNLSSKSGTYSSQSTWTQSSKPKVLQSVRASGTPNDLGITYVAVNNGKFTNSNGYSNSFSSAVFGWGRNDYFRNTSGVVGPVTGGLIQNVAPNSNHALFKGSVENPEFEEGIWTSNYGGTNTITVSEVPEPANWAMMIAGFGLTGAAARRRRATTAIA
jgi:hypothetical protein